MLTFTDEELRKKLIKNPPKPNAPNVRAAADAIAFLPITTDLHTSVKEDVDFLKEHPLVLAETKFSGFIFHVENGKLEKVV